ncbi:MAG: glycosyltransferase family 39 protein [Anaerolineales bacterium]|nr:glycosyltransferase family 39 protein [Anaerolineales bacterium]
MKSNSLLYSIFGLIFFWVIFVLGGYYLYHKPFSFQQLLIWIKFGYLLFVGLLILACGGGVGLAILSRFETGSIFSTIQSAGLGLGILGTIYFMLSWIVGVRWWYSLLLIGLILVGFRSWILHWLKNFLRTTHLIIPQNGFSTAMAIVTFFLVVASGFVAAAPPLAFDSLVYHLSLPMVYLQRGKFDYIPENTFWGMPQLGEMLYTFAISISAIEGGQIMGWLIGLLSLLGIAELLREYLSQDQLWVTLTAILCGTTFVESLSWGYVDWMTFFYGVCVIQTLNNWAHTYQLRYLILGGVFCGFALGTKYTAGILILAMMVVLLIFPKISKSSAQSRENSNQTLSIVLLGLVCFLVSIPWWLKNFFSVGQPFYPLLIPAGEMTAPRIEFYSGLQPFGNEWTAVFLPITATILGVEGKEGFNASIGPLILLFAPFALIYLLERDNREVELVRICILLALTGWVVWGVGSRLAGYLIQSRLYWAIFPSLAILSGFGYRKLCMLKLGNLHLRFVLNNLLFFVFLLTALEIFSSMLQKRALDFFMGHIDSQSYLTHNLGWHFVAMQKVRRLGQKTLLLFEPRNLYCLPRCDGDELLDEWYFASLNTLEPEEVLRRWKARSYQHVLIFNQGADFVRQKDQRYQERQWELFDQLIPLLSLEQSFGTAYTLYRIP